MKVMTIKKAAVATLAVFALSQPLYAADEAANNQAEQNNSNSAASEKPSVSGSSVTGTSAFAANIGLVIAAVLGVVGQGDSHASTSHHNPQK